MASGGLPATQVLMLLFLRAFCKRQRVIKPVPALLPIQKDVTKPYETILFVPEHSWDAETDVISALFCVRGENAFSLLLVMRK